VAKRATTRDKAREVSAVSAKARAREARTRPARKPRGPKANPPDRPLRLEYIQASTLSPNPANWRRHPPGQMNALRQTLDRVGWAGALLFNEATGNLLDGHARLELVKPEDFVPVMIGSWTPEREREILATLDPIAALARADETRLNELLAELEVDGLSAESGDALGDLLASIPELVPPELEPAEEEDGEPDGGSGEGGGGGDYEPSAKILLTCNSSTHQETLLDVIDRLAAGESVAMPVIRDAFAGVASKALNG
jgi:hypothetical protein